MQYDYIDIFYLIDDHFHFVVRMVEHVHPVHCACVVGRSPTSTRARGRAPPRGGTTLSRDATIMSFALGNTMVFSIELVSRITH